MVASENLTPGLYEANSDQNWTVIDPKDGQRIGYGFSTNGDNIIEILGPIEHTLKTSIRPGDGAVKQIYETAGLRFRAVTTNGTKELVIAGSSLPDVNLHEVN